MRYNSIIVFCKPKQIRESESLLCFSFMEGKLLGNSSQRLEECNIIRLANGVRL